MIVVTGTVTARKGQLEQVLALATEHVLRSRGEPGCISHAVFHDPEVPLRLQFVERWTDMDALKVHFAVPASGETVRAMAALCSEPPTMEVYDATEVMRR
jgi:quinol monooxygenase YgiN